MFCCRSASVLTKALGTAARESLAPPPYAFWERYEKKGVEVWGSANDVKGSEFARDGGLEGEFMTDDSTIPFTCKELVLVGYH